MIYVVRFVRKDGKATEEYYYPKIEQAEEHYSLFLDDDSGLYTKIELTDYNGTLIKEMVFSEV